jgi:hypothetical protein
MAFPASDNLSLVCDDAQNPGIGDKTSVLSVDPDDLRSAALASAVFILKFRHDHPPSFVHEEGLHFVSFFTERNYLPASRICNATRVIRHMLQLGMYLLPEIRKKVNWARPS